MLRWWISFSPLSHLSSCHTHTHPYLSRLIFSSLPLGGQVFARIHMPLRPTLNALWWAHIPFSHSQPASSCDSRRTGWNRPKLGGRADCVGDGGGKDDVKGKKEPWVGWGTGLIDVNKNKFTGISSCHFCWKQSTSCFCSLLSLRKSGLQLPLKPVAISPRLYIMLATAFVLLGVCWDYGNWSRTWLCGSLYTHLHPFWQNYLAHKFLLNG